jgi:hypothetical protein
MICWCSHGLKDTAIWMWATSRLRTTRHLRATIKAGLDDALSYVKLVQKWEIFTVAATRLPRVGNLWLFEKG